MKRYVLIGFILSVVITNFSFAQTLHQDEGFKFTFPFGKKYDYNNILVKRVLDVKTIILEDGQQVRLIGVDNPKTGNSAGYLRDLIEGAPVRLEFDQQKYDRSGHLFAYIYLSDGRLVNALLIKEGYALAGPEITNVRFKGLFSQLQTEAKEDKRGLWAQ